ncbi:MAG TPA: RDD family protein [Planctomycetaceae bacterium]|jgi:uncharacterized RDD family membrane protein YckC|nr:RDD family protein [Planctomycetaceae bacterium]
MSEPATGKAGWIAVYILRRGRQYRVSIVDALLADGWTIDDEQSVCVEASTDLGKLKDEIDRRCQPPLTRAEALAVVAALRGHVLDQPIGSKYSTIEFSGQKYATLLRRFGATWIDGLIFAPLTLLYLYAPVRSASAPWQVLVYVAYCSAYPLYSIWMHGKYGQTLGKMACKVIVLDVSETPLSMKQAVLRNIYAVVVVPIDLVVNIPLIIRGIDITNRANWSVTDRILLYVGMAWFTLEIITVLANRKRRALHDFIAGSVVVRTS